MMGNWKINEDVIDNTAIYYLFKKYNNNEIEPFIDYNNERLTTIRHNVLRECKTINSFYAPNVTCIAYAAFMNSSLTEYNLNSIIRVMDYAFYGCNNYHGDFENNLRFNEIEIGNYSFYHCNYIKNLYANYINIGNNAFILATSQDEGLQNIFVENAYNFYNYAFSNQKNLKQVCNQNLDQINYINRIGNYAFNGCINLTDVYVNTINYINAYAFNQCTSLTIFNASYIKNIGANAFYKCNSLVQLSDMTIDTAYLNAFNQCNLTDLVNVKLKNIKSDAFHGSSLTNLTNVSLQNIQLNAFDSLSTLKQVTINNLNNVVNSNIFNNCTNLSYIQINSGTINATPFQNIGNIALTVKLTNQTCIPIEAGAFNDSVKYFYANTYTGVFPDAMFQGCTTLNTVNIKNSEKVSKYMFSDCEQLSKCICRNVIDDYAFNNCSINNLGDFYNLVSIGNYGLYNGMIDRNGVNATFTHLQQACNYAFGKINYNRLTFPVLTTIYSDTFKEFSGNGLCCNILTATPSNMCNNLTQLQELYINKVKTINEYTCNNCYNLTIVNCNSGTSSLQSLLTDIHNYAFSNCRALTTFITNSTTINVGTNAFNGCVALTTFNGVVNFITGTNYQFYNCKALTSIKLLNTVTAIPNYCFYFSNALKTIGTENNIANLYYITQVGNYSFYNGGIVDLRFDNTKEVIINNDSFNGCPITSITWPKIAKLGTYVFMKTALTSVDVTNIRNSSNTMYIPNFTFKECKNLTTVTGLNHTINGYAFSQCTALTNVQGQITNITDYAFNGCTTLTIFDCPVSGSLYQYAFNGCTSLTDLKNIHYVYSNAFRNHPSLTNITNINDMGNASFYECTSLTNLGNIKQANTYAFYGCTSLTNTNSITNVKDYSFYNCTGLEKIHTQLLSLGNSAFSKCSNIKGTVTIGDVGTFPKYVFNGCSNIQTLTQNRRPPTDYSVDTNYDNYCFNGCTNIHFTWGLGAITIKDYAFNGCTKISTIGSIEQSFPISLRGELNTTIGKNAFANCGIVNLRINGLTNGNITFDEYVFSNNTKVDISLSGPGTNYCNMILNPYAFSNNQIVKVNSDFCLQSTSGGNFNDNVFYNCSNVRLIIKRSIKGTYDVTTFTLLPGSAFTGTTSYSNVWLKVPQAQLPSYRTAWQTFFHNTQETHIVNTTSNWSWEQQQ